MYVHLKVRHVIETMYVPLLSERRRELVITDVPIFGEECEKVLERPLSHVDTVWPVPHGACSPETHTELYMFHILMSPLIFKRGYWLACKTILLSVIPSLPLLQHTLLAIEMWVQTFTKL